MKKRISALLVFALCIALVPLAMASSMTGDEAIQIAREKVTEYDPYAEGQKEAYLYSTESESGTDNWLVTVAVPTYNSANVIDFFVLTIQPDGQIANVVVDPTGYARDAGNGEDILALKALSAERGPWYGWSIEQRVAFADAFYNGGYRMPGDGDLTQEQALELAKAALKAQRGVTDAEITRLHSVANLCVADAGDYWIVSFYLPENNTGVFGTEYPHQVNLSNPGGEIIFVSLSGDGNG